MKLTSTNSSIGLITLIYQCPLRAREYDQIMISILRLPGDYCGAPPPDPISNSAVKRSSADGTAKAGE